MSSYPPNTARAVYDRNIRDRIDELKKLVEEDRVRVENVRACAPDLLPRAERHLAMDEESLRINEAFLRTIQRIHEQIERKAKAV